MTTSGLRARTVFVTCAAIAALGLQTLAAADKVSTKIAGYVRDSAGVAVANADVTATLLDCACSKCSIDCACCPDGVRGSTDHAGHYELSVGPGKYEVTVTAAGFKNMSSTIDAELAMTATRDFRFGIGSPESEIEVN